jgi:glutamate dehydrogenase
MQVALRNGQTLPDGEGSALLRWFLDGNFTLLGYIVTDRDGTSAATLGMLRMTGHALWSSEAHAAAIGWFEQGGTAPLMVKADAIATVHRRARST